MGKDKKKKNFFINFSKKHPIGVWIITIIFSLISLILGFSTTFFFPDGVESLNHYGFHGLRMDFSTFRFDFQKFETNYSYNLTDSKQILVIHNDYKADSFPKLEISGNLSRIKIICTEQETKNECNKGFPIRANSYAVLELNIRFENPEKNEYRLHFKIIEGNNFRNEDIKILIK